MSEKLFITKDSPEKLKEVIKVAQQYLDNATFYKTKADRGTLSLQDLEELAEKNNLLANQLPKATNPPPGCPPATTNLEELKGYGKMKARESKEKLAMAGGPAYKVSSLEQLVTLSNAPPDEAGQEVLDAGKKRSAEKREEEKEEKGFPKLAFKGDFHVGLFNDYLAKIQYLLHNAKLVYFYLQDDWHTAGAFEEPLAEEAKTFEDFRQGGVETLIGVFQGKDESEAVADKQQEAAFILASIQTKDDLGLHTLIETWKADEEKAPIVTKALKYSVNPSLDLTLESLLAEEAPEGQALMLEILDYRQAVDEKLWDELFAREDPVVNARIYRAYANRGIKKIKAVAEDYLLDKPEEAYFEEALFSALINGTLSALYTARKQIREAPDQVCDLPLFLACAGDAYDIGYLKEVLEQETAFQSTIMALGIHGMPEAVPILIDAFSPNITSEEEWYLQHCILESLNLITGAGLEMPLPDANVNMEGEEPEVTIETGLKSRWTHWWYENRDRFHPDVRYRRGRRFSLAGCIDEMAYPRGNFWTRQYAYYELRIRSGKSIAPFFADWYVRDQKNAIDQWTSWWLNEGDPYKGSPWLFNGKTG